MVEKMISRLNEIESLMADNESAAEESCLEEGLPARGSDFELRVEAYNKCLEEEQAEILEQDYADLICYNNGRWVKR